MPMGIFTWGSGGRNQHPARSLLQCLPPPSHHLPLQEQRDPARPGQPSAIVCLNKQRCWGSVRWGCWWWGWCWWCHWWCHWWWWWQRWWAVGCWRSSGLGGGGGGVIVEGGREGGRWGDCQFKDPDPPPHSLFHPPP